MYTYTNSECLSIDKCEQVALKDAPKMSKDVKNYVKANSLSYYILINTWLLLIKDLAGHAWTFVAELIVKDGLIPTIKAFQEEAQSLISGGVTGDVARVLYQFARTCKNPFDSSHVTDTTAVALLLMLRYPRRFSPNENDLIKDASLQDFIQTENRTKQLQAKGYSYYVLTRVRDEVHKMYDWDSIVREIKSLDPSDLMFSNGVGRDSGPSLGSKLLAIAKGNHCEEYFMTPFGARMIPVPVTQEEGPRVVTPMAVPKSYKASRIIAPEDTYRQALAKRVEYIFRQHDRVKFHWNLTPLENAYRGYVPMWLEDQGINQLLAEEGSITGQLATLDASHASDMISKSLFRYLFPSSFVACVDPLLSEFTEINGKIRRMQMMSTSGHSLTFRLETIVYKAIAAAAASWVENFSTSQAAFSWAYGDDVIINTDAAETACEWYNALGLVINKDKSFTSPAHKYRESCGKEYFDGVDVSVVAFPRFPIVGKCTATEVVLSKRAINDEYRGKIDCSLTMLIDLSKKLYPVSISAWSFLLDVLKAAEPRLTTSLPGANCTDPWGYIDTGKPVYPRAYEIIPEERKMLEFDEPILGSHECHRTRFPWILGYHPVWQVTSASLKQVPVPDFASREELEKWAKLDARHSCPKVKFKDPAGTGDRDLMIRVYELYKYQRFLRFGPEYDSDLDALLGVSARPISFAEFYGRKELVLAYV